MTGPRFALLVLLFVLSAASPVNATENSDERRVLVFGDSNSWGWIPVVEGRPSTRYSDAERWPGVLQNQLPEETTVVVDALSGRTVDVAHEATVGTLEGAAFNGAAALPSAIARELPLDMVVVMLGTNDARSDLDRDPLDVANGMCSIAEVVRTSEGGVLTTYPAPELLVVVPPLIGDTSRTPIGRITVDGPARSGAVGDAIVSAADRCGYAVFDARDVIEIESIDGVHFSAQDHETLGLALAPVIAESLDEADR